MTTNVFTQNRIFVLSEERNGDMTNTPGRIS